MWPITNRDRLRRVIDAFIAAVSLTSGLVVVLPLLVAIGVTMAGWLTGHSRVAAVAMGAAGAVLICAIGAFTVLHPVIRRVLYGYRFERLEMYYRIDDDDWWHHLLRVHIHLRVIRTGLRIVQNRYTCSTPFQGEGDTPAHRPSIVAGAQAIFGPLFDNPSWIYWILLGDAMSARRTREIRLEQQFADTQRNGRQHLSKTVTEPIDQLVLRVRVPDAMWPVEAEAYERTPGQDRARPLTLVKDGPVRELRLIIRKPSFGREYGITWNTPPQAVRQEIPDRTEKQA